MSEKFNIEISQPCSEKWEKMQPCGQGRFCLKCEKMVTDFSGKSRKEIKNVIQNNNVCGRFDRWQLEGNFLSE